MPTYLVNTASERLSAAAKHSIASAITRIHSEVTHAPLYLAQVIFNEIPPGNHFMAGTLADPDVVFIHGQVRSGRSAEQKRELLVRIVDAVSAATVIPKTAIWAYVVDLPPAQMVEYGHLLPEPGMEDVWLASLPEADRLQIAGVGKR